MISREEALHIAQLAKLKLAEEEIAMFQEQLSRILEHFQKLRELDTTNIEPMKHVYDVYNVFRADEPQPSVSTEEALKNAPKRREGYFEVPKIVEKG